VSLTIDLTRRKHILTIYNSCQQFQRIRGYFSNEVRYINPHFTYLLTHSDSHTKNTALTSDDETIYDQTIE